MRNQLIGDIDGIGKRIELFSRLLLGLDRVDEDDTGTASVRVGDGETAGRSFQFDKAYGAVFNGIVLTGELVCSLDLDADGRQSIPGPVAIDLKGKHT